MKLNGLAIVLATVLAAASAGAQQTAKFARIDCAASQLQMPPNLICLASNEVAGDFAGGSAGGLFKYWNAIGKVGSRKAYVYGVEAMDGRSEVRVTQALSEAVDIITPYAKPASHFSDLRSVATQAPRPHRRQWQVLRGHSQLRARAVDRLSLGGVRPAVRSGRKASGGE